MPAGSGSSQSVDRKHDLPSSEGRVGVDDLADELGPRGCQEPGGVRPLSREANLDAVVPVSREEPAAHLHEVRDRVSVLRIVHVAGDLERRLELDGDRIHDLDEPVPSQDEAADQMHAQIDVITLEGRAPAGIRRLRRRTRGSRKPDLRMCAHDAVDRHEDALDVVRRERRPALDAHRQGIDADVHDLSGQRSRGERCEGASRPAEMGTGAPPCECSRAHPPSRARFQVEIAHRSAFPHSERSRIGHLTAVTTVAAVAEEPHRPRCSRARRRSR